MEEPTGLEDIFVARLMSSDVTTITADALVEDAAKTMLDAGIGSVIVVDDDDRLQGILTTTDFVRIVAERQPKDRTPVEEYMTQDVKTSKAGESITDAARTMLDAGIHHLPVVDDEDHVIGIITTTDLTAYISQVEAPA